MKPPELKRHLTWIVAIKLIGLLLLWWLFVHSRQVVVDGHLAAAHVAGPAASSPQGKP